MLIRGLRGVIESLMGFNCLLRTDSPKVAPPMPPTEGRFDVVIDNDAIRCLDLSSFQKTTGIISPLASKFWVGWYVYVIDLKLVL